MEGNLILLIAADDLGTRIEATLAADPAKAAVTRVDSLFDALRMLQEGAFDMIITELALPDSPAGSTLKSLKQEATQTPVIVLCSTGEREEGVAAVKNGASDLFHQDNLDEEALKRSVRKAVTGDGAGNTAANRRAGVRFPVKLAVNYQALESPFFSGTALSETVNISSKGLLFAASHPLQPGQLLQVSVDWPARLENEIPLKLVAEGRVIRIVDGQAAVKIDKYEFRTRRAKGETK